MEKRIEFCHSKAKAYREKAIIHCQSQILAAETSLNSPEIEGNTQNIRETGRLERLRMTLTQKQFQLQKLGEKVHFIRIPISRHSCISVQSLLIEIQELIQRLQLEKEESLYIYSHYGHGRVGTIGACLLGSLYGLSFTDSLHMTQLAVNYTVIERTKPVSLVCPALPLQRQRVIEFLNIMNQKFVCPVVNWTSSVNSGVNYSVDRSNITHTKDIGSFGNKISLATSGMYETPFTNERQDAVKHTLSEITTVKDNKYVIPPSLNGANSSSQPIFRQQQRSYNLDMYKPSLKEYHAVTTRPHEADCTLYTSESNPFTTLMDTVNPIKRVQSPNPIVNRIVMSISRKSLDNERNE